MLCQISICIVWIFKQLLRHANVSLITKDKCFGTSSITQSYYWREYLQPQLHKYTWPTYSYKCKWGKTLFVGTSLRALYYLLNKKQRYFKYQARIHIKISVEWLARSRNVCFIRHDCKQIFRIPAMVANKPHCLPYRNLFHILLLATGPF